MQIEIDRNSSVPIYIQISNKIRAMILSGYLPGGYKLPPERKLSEQLEVNRSTVLNAYRELKSEGLVDSYVGQGTIVSISEGYIEYNKPDNIQWKQAFSDNASRIREAVSIDIMEIANRKDTISFAAGIANSELDPLNDLKLIQDELMEEHGNEIYRIAPTEGILPLRESIKEFINCRGISSKIDEIIVLTGSQQGIEFTARTLINPGDIVIVEEPSFFQHFKFLSPWVLE